jgi:hypothetical protein
VNPYVGAPVIVNVGGAQADGSDVAAGLITAVRPDGRVNVRVQYDGPDEHFHHHPEWLEDVPFYDTSDYLSANQGGLFGAFWPGGSMQDQLLQTIIEQQEKIMTALDALKAADVALKSEVTTAIADWATTLANASNDPAVQAVADDMNAMVTQIKAADPAVTTTPSSTSTGTPVSSSSSTATGN